MRNFLAFVGALVIAIVAIGIWQGWFKFAVDSEQKITIEADGKKAGEDVKEFSDKAKEKLNDAIKKPDGTTPASLPTGK